MIRPLHHFLTNLFPDEHRWKIPLLQKWNEIIGNLSDKVILEKITHDSLVLLVCHPSWAQELYILTPLIKKKANAVIGHQAIKQIRFKVGPLPERRAAPLSKTEKPDHVEQQLCIQGANSVFLSVEEQKVLQRVEQSELKKELVSFFARCKRLQK